MPTTPAPAPRVAAVVAVLALGASACDSGPGAPDAGVSDRPSSAPGDAAATPGAGATPADTESEARWSSPLDEFLDTGLQVDEAEIERRRDDYQDRLTACMAAEGFDYIPPDQDDEVVQETVPWDLPRDQFVTSYGYGMTTIEPPEGPAFDTSVQLEAMSPAERAAYHRALHGDELPLGEDGYPDPDLVEEVDEVVQDRGCAGTAIEEVFGIGPESNDAFTQYDGLLNDMYAIGDRIAQDPRVVEATRAWSDCMAAAGHPFGSPDEARDAVQDRVLTAMGGTGDVVSTRLSPAGGDLEAPEVVMIDGGSEEIDPARLEELRAFELTVARADRDCAVEHDLRRVERDVQAELEEAFIEERHDELEAYRDLSNEGSN